MRLAGSRVVVAGLGVTGPSVVRALHARGATVVAVDGRTGPREVDLADQLRGDGVTVLLGADAVSGAGGVLDGADLVVTSPGWRPDNPLLLAAAARQVPVWGDVELAYRLRPTDQPWLGVTGTNGKTTTVLMLASILRAAGHHAVAAGNVGLPVLEAALADPPYDVLALELSSFQLHWTSTMRLYAGAVLNVAPDHLDWHGSLEAYGEDKARVWRGAAVRVLNLDDPATVALLGRASDPDEPAAVVAVTSGRPDIDTAIRQLDVASRLAAPRLDGLLGVVEGRAGVVASRLVEQPGGAVLAEVSDIRPPAPHNVANALAAAALARSLDHGGVLSVPPDAVAAGLRALAPGPHRIAHVVTVDGVDWVDDSKATNPHAAAASLAAFPSVVWVAGGLAKGARFEELVIGAADRLRGVVLLGRDRALVAEALARHAPEIPVLEVTGPETGGRHDGADEVGAGATVMDDVVRAAAGLAAPGDTVLLAPACASMDMFRDYAQRGDAFAAAARRLTGVRPTS